VKAHAHFAGPLQGNIGRKPGIGAQHPGPGRTHRMRVEVNHLAHGMHAFVGAPGADGNDGVARDEGKRGLYRVLNRAGVYLRLPAGVAGAVIFDDGGDTAAGVGHTEPRSLNYS